MTKHSGNEKVVSSLTSYLRRLVRDRKNGVVTADDAQRYLSRNGFNGNQNMRLSIVRSALKTPTFRPVGYLPSARPEARGRMITMWTK